MKKDDKRRLNGKDNAGLTQDQQLVRGPKKLIEAMRALATKEEGINDIWRKAAQQFLDRVSKPEEK